MHKLGRSHSLRKLMCLSSIVFVLFFISVAIFLIVLEKSPLKVISYLRSLRIDCSPSPHADKMTCLSRHCHWDGFFDPHDATVPMCFYPKNTGYSLAATTVDSSSLTRYSLIKDPDSVKNPFGSDYHWLHVTRENIGSTLNVRIAPPRDKRCVVLFFSRKDEPVRERIFGTLLPVDSDHWHFGAMPAVFLGGLLYADQYIQIATMLPSEFVYGFGEHVHPGLKHNFSHYTTWPMFARDQPPNSKNINRQNLYGVQPFYLCIEQDGKAHGVLILNSNAQEITTGPGPLLVYRTLGGILDMYFFPGPSPEAVIAQYAALVGLPTLPPYWALGFQLSRYGYKSTADLRMVVERNRKADIPLDVVYVDIDYMDERKDFTIGQNWSELPKYITELHSYNMHVILIFDPAIQVDYPPFERAIQRNVSFVSWPHLSLVPKNVNNKYQLTKNTTVMLGVVWSEHHVAFPDFLDPENSTLLWWTDELAFFRTQLAFDGIWIDMNEPSNFGTNQVTVWHSNLRPLSCPVGKLDDPEFATNAVYLYGKVAKIDTICFHNCRLSSKTLCMSASTSRGDSQFYDTKNLYGWSESKLTWQAMNNITDKRTVVISRSTFTSSGRYSGHWLGDNSATWSDLKSSIVAIVEFNLFSIPFVGADICGFNRAANEELCLRWHQAAAFHSFSRNHNSDDQPHQDPAVWSSVAEAAKKALNFRYRYLPFLYSLHFSASLKGHTVLRPLFFEFPQDSNALLINYQFLWGSALLITPVLDPGQSTVQGYFPDDVWYSIYEHNYTLVQKPGFHSLFAPTTSMIPVHIRGGSIVPRQKPLNTAVESRKNPLELLIAIDSDNEAKGELYWDDGESFIDAVHYQWAFIFVQSQSQANLTLQKLASPILSLSIPTLDIIEILGYTHRPDFDSFQFDGIDVHIDIGACWFNETANQLFVHVSGLVNLTTISGNRASTLSWKHQS